MSSVASLLLRSRAAASPLFCNKPSHKAALYFCHQLANRRNMSSSGDFLINEPKYAFLKELGLDTLNKGVYHGKWAGSGEVSNPHNPYLFGVKPLFHISELQIRNFVIQRTFNILEFNGLRILLCQLSSPGL